MTLHPLTDSEIQSFIQMSLNLKVFIQEIIYLKRRMGYMQ